VDFTFVHGKAIVEKGQLVPLDLSEHIQKHNSAAARLLSE
jgi:hypothetical protein